MVIENRYRNIDELKAAYANSHCYLYSQHSSWLEPTKVNMFYGIWKRVKKSHPDTLLIKTKDEPCNNEAGLVKFFGLAEVKISELDYVIENLAGEFDNCLFVSTREFDVIYDLFSHQFSEKLIMADFFNKKSKTEALTAVLSSTEVIVRPNYQEEDLLTIEIIDI